MGEEQKGGRREIRFGSAKFTRYVRDSRNVERIMAIELRRYVVPDIANYIGQMNADGEAEVRLSSRSRKYDVDKKCYVVL